MCKCPTCESKRLGQKIHEQLVAALAADQQEDIEVAAITAQINLQNAEAVAKLTEAAQALFDMGEIDHGKRVLLALDKLLPQREDRRSEDTTPESSPTRAADDNVYLHFQGDRGTGKSYLAKVIEKALLDLGFDTRLGMDPEHESEVLSVLNPAKNILEREAFLKESNATASAPVDEFEGVPSFIKEYVLGMRKAGIEIEVKRFPFPL